MEHFPCCSSADIDYLCHLGLSCCTRFLPWKPWQFPGDTGLLLTPGDTVSAEHWQLKAPPALLFLLPLCCSGQDGQSGYCATKCSICSLSCGQTVLGEGQRNVSTLPTPALPACWFAREWGASVGSAFLLPYLFSQFCTEEWESASLGTPLVGLARLLHSQAPYKQWREWERTGTLILCLSEFS